MLRTLAICSNAPKVVAKDGEGVLSKLEREDAVLLWENCKLEAAAAAAAENASAELDDVNGVRGRQERGIPTSHTHHAHAHL